ncbi:hypothetical protein T265_11012 [Opisthorchis viverrini]|uniref:Uncharacterized protein n=1 Tax=Opisthorchis viverrini TaxID=6198 RepID=A0A074Z084_OPIVI|nr:hypothetical protein T265_11012 [Opisthorchis viverrini]KER20451.1 hypothetical protein T265_11012 [Opisthorchis viverrini]
MAVTGHTAVNSPQLSIRGSEERHFSHPPEESRADRKCQLHFKDNNSDAGLSLAVFIGKFHTEETSPTMDEFSTNRRTHDMKNTC